MVDGWALRLHQFLTFIPGLVMSIPGAHCKLLGDGTPAPERHAVYTGYHHDVRRI
jgi:hypothetical protein